MNKNLYRVIFNRVQGMLIVVPEIAGTHSAEGPSSGRGQTFGQLIAGLSPLVLMTSIALGLISVSLPAQADIVADPNAPGNQQPTVLGSGNGTPQVNIQTPSAGGVSRNTYSQFDVDNRGAILNNSGTSVQTQLGGYIDGNPNMAQGSAKIILNEVNSRNPSHLNGYVEVAGQKAQVVIANPSGITCDGCGFINSNRATLTTGTPVMNNGNLEGYDVHQGKVTIQGKGLDGSKQSYTDIVAQSVEVNAGVWANELNVVTGKNKVSADTKRVEKQGSNDTNSPQFSVDVSALGGMYANSIRMVGTENGVGVRNAGNIGAQAGSVVITADGRIENKGTISSAQSLQISTQQGINNQGTLQAQQDVTLTAQGKIENTNAGKISAAENTTVTTQDNLTNRGTIAASKKATIKNNANTSNSGTIVAGQELSVSTNTLDNSGTLKSHGHTTINTQGYLNNVTGSQIISEGFLRIDNGGNLMNQGDISASAGAELTSQSTFINSGILYSKGDLWISAEQSISNQGTISAEHNLNLTTYGSLFNQEMIYGKGLVSLNAGGNITNQGTIGSDSSLKLATTGSLLNSGFLQSRRALEVHTDNGINNSGTINTNSDLSLVTKGSLKNDGTIYTKNNATINATGLITNTGMIGADRNLTLTTADSLRNRGTLYSKGTGNYRIDGDFINSKLMRSEDQLLLNADGSIINEADIFAFAGLNLSSGQNFYNRSKVYSGGEMNLRVANNIVNSSALVALNNIMLVATSVNNTNEALLAAGVNDNGEMAGHGNITINVEQPANLQGQIVATGGINVVANGINLSGALVSADSMVLQAQHGDINTDFAHLFFTNSLSAKTTSNWSNLGGKLYADQLTLNAASLDNDASGEIRANTTRLNINGTLTNRGLIDGVLTELQAQQINNYGSGRIYGTWLHLQADTINNRFENGVGATLMGRKSINIGTNILNNYTHSQIFSGGDISVGRTLDKNGLASGWASEINNHSATIEARGNLQLSVSQLKNINDNFVAELQEGSDEVTIIESDPAKILASGNLTISADTVLNDKSQIKAGGILNIDANQITDIKIPGSSSGYDVGLLKQNTDSDQEQQKYQYMPDTVSQNSMLKPSGTQSSSLLKDNQNVINPNMESYRPNINIGAMNIDQVTIQVNEIDGPGEINIVVSSPAQDILLANANLHIVPPAVGNSVLVESDPKFTQYKTWLATDYMSSKLRTDHNNTHQRLSDNYHEQQFVRDQTINLTGQPSLNHATNDEEQYTAMMNAGIEFAQKYDLPLGVPLTSEQISNLTSDIIWLINHEVIQTDGSKQTVLIPHIYAVMKL
ncbi:filamentous hemagglutinin N-terminal domain-containing protein [Jinshanibacter sp. LJY008]|uniref:Filamentous hemagglutinin N-terminal domain-containing protein n=1 Tax=Limnobaculum eriocheiris TaxID=2897391 RepID=A0A9X1SKM8_9GAMM|nr:filamentous hemagglutinin N-terminal domain-containing protein [Limnobaculum eriocheiris]MCD1125840.1 filamentous hemagglutinin N-terminal domain-containing protein [Limnobaculum eriocheiris]